MICIAIQTEAPPSQLFFVKPVVCCCVYLNSQEQITPVQGLLSTGPFESNWPNWLKVGPLYTFLCIWDQAWLEILPTNLYGNFSQYLGPYLGGKQFFHKHSAVVYLNPSQQGVEYCNVYLASNPTIIRIRCWCVFLVQHSLYAISQL